MLWWTGAVVVLISGFLVVYHHALYPLILRRLAAKRPVVTPKHVERSFGETLHDDTLPTVTLIVPAYNEAEVIADKVRNLATVDYPPESFKVIIACDGCSDDTAKIARQTRDEPECYDLDLQVLEFEQNRGKVAVLNDVVQRVETDVVALTDASAMVSVDCLLVAAAHFEDEQVGVITGTYQLLFPGSAGEETYWKYQIGIKRRESAMGAPLGVHGAFYMFRRKLFEPLPADTINDDFILPMNIIANGFEGRYEGEIRALELEQADSGLDQRRRRRIAAGNVQQVMRLWRLLHPRYKGVAFTFASGKALRVTMPFLMIISFIGSGLLMGRDDCFGNFFAFVFWVQAFVYAIAVIRQLLIKVPMPGPVEAIHYLVSGHFAGLIGVVRYLIGLDRGAWKRANS